MAPDAVRQQWQDATREILESLDIKAEYESLGVQFTGTTPTAKGYLECRAIDRDDRGPSAGVCVGDGQERGRYKQFNDGDSPSYSLFNFASEFGPHPDWKAARSFYAEKAGIKLPRSGGKHSSDNLLVSSLLVAGDQVLFCRAKPPIKPEALKLAGGRSGVWPKFLNEPNQVIAFPGYNYRGADSDPSSWHLVGSHGQMITKASRPKKGDGGGNGAKKKATITRSKTIDLNGGGNLYGQHGVIHWDKAEIVWLVEGITDLLAIQSVLGDRVDHIAVTLGGASASFGVGWPERFAGKQVHICYDNDRPNPKDGKQTGQLGAVARAGDLAGHAKSIKIVKLPKQGSDLRDFLRECSYDDLLDLANESAPIKAKTQAGALAEQMPEGTLANCFEIPSGEGNAVTVVPIAQQAIFDRMLKETDNWPRRCGEMLFSEVEPGRIRYLRTGKALFSYLHDQFPANLKWHDRGPGLVTKSEFLNKCETDCMDYDSIERFPHFPRMKGFYYSTPDYSSGGPTDGSALAEFLDFFNPSTNADHDLLKAAVLTLFWGGAPGTRPVFLFTSDEGRGVGKTATAQSIANLTGGAFHLDRAESVERIKSRLIMPESVGKRVALLDNIKSNNFSWAEFESMVTSDVISGWILHKGDGSRPNTLTWMLTLNAPALSKDISQRVIAIKLDRPAKYSKTWIPEIREFVAENHFRIVADIQTLFSEEAYSVGQTTRWAYWEEAVLGRTVDPEEAARVIVERQAEYDVDEMETGELREFIAEKLEMLRYGKNEQVHIPTKTFHEWYEKWSGERITSNKMSRKINQWCQERTTKWLFINPCKTHGRGWVYDPTERGCANQINYDLDDRISSP